jgi:hypothetical protein
MFARSAMFVCAAAFVAVAQPAFADDANQRCAAQSFRIYFQHGSATLDDTAMQMLDAAERSVADCDYAELHVAVDASSPQARARANAIRAAADGRAWNEVRVSQNSAIRDVSFGPEFAEVQMTIEATPAGEPLRDMPAAGSST